MEPGQAASLPSPCSQVSSPQATCCWLSATQAPEGRAGGTQASPENAVSGGKDVATLSSTQLLRQTLKAKTGGQSPFPWELFSHRTGGERCGA